MSWVGSGLWKEGVVEMIVIFNKYVLNTVKKVVFFSFTEVWNKAWCLNLAFRMSKPDVDLERVADHEAVSAVQGYHCKTACDCDSIDSAKSLYSKYCRTEWDFFLSLWCVEFFAPPLLSLHTVCVENLRKKMKFVSRIKIRT